MRDAVATKTSNLQHRTPQLQTLAPPAQADASGIGWSIVEVCCQLLCGRIRALTLKSDRVFAAQFGPLMENPADWNRSRMAGRWRPPSSSTPEERCRSAMRASMAALGRWLKSPRPLGVSPRTSEHLEARFLEVGIEAALERKTSTTPRKLTFAVAFDARLTALVCSPAPTRRARRTVRLPAEKVVERKLAPNPPPVAEVGLAARRSLPAH